MVLTPVVRVVTVHGPLPCNMILFQWVNGSVIAVQVVLQSVELKDGKNKSSRDMVQDST